MTAGSPVASADLTQREAVAMACRVLAHRGLAEGILGHISLRITDTELLVRGPQERGLAYTEASDIHLDPLRALKDGKTTSLGSRGRREVFP